MTSIRTVALVALVAGALVAPVATAQPTAAKAPLYDRLGGLKGITMVVDDFIDRLVVNETLNRNPAINAGRQSSPAPYLKFQVSQMVCAATGGPCKYTGRSMKDAHAHLNINEAQWQALLGDFRASLAHFNVPAREQQELIAIVESTKPDIVIAR